MSWRGWPIVFTFVAIFCGMFGIASPEAQEAGATTATFSLSSSRIFTTTDTPQVFATFQNLDHLDVRVYKVEELETFFRGLPDPHMVGSPEPVVAQEPTLIERLASWKTRERGRLQDLVRRQFSTPYRRARSIARDRERLAERRTVRNYTQFAQVPLLNPRQLVNSWREVLPRTRDAESRRIPLDLPGAGVYLVEALYDRQRAYTIVAVSDLGLVTKTAPGQLLAWTVNRLTGEPRSDCRLTPLSRDTAVGSFTGDTNGVVSAVLGEFSQDALVSVARCGTDFALADPGGYFLQSPTGELLGYIYTDRPVYRPGQPIHAKAILRWRERGLVRPFDRKDVEVSIVDPADNVVYRVARVVDDFGGVSLDWTSKASAALGVYSVRVVSGDLESTGHFEIQEYRKPEFEVSVTPAASIVVQGQQLRVTFAARYFFGQPVAGGRVQWSVQTGSYYSPFRWVDSSDIEGTSSPAFYGGDQVSAQRIQLDATGTASVVVPLPDSEDGSDMAVRIEARVSDASGREVAGQATVVAPRARLLVALAADRYVYRAGERAAVRARVVDYRGQSGGPMPIRFALEKLTYPEGRYDTPAVERVNGGETTTDENGRADWAVQVPAEPGDYRVRAEISVDGRQAAGVVSVYLPDADSTFYDEGDRTLELVADRASYRPGDTASLVIRGEPITSPILVTKEHAQTTWYRVVRPGTGAFIEVPLEPEDVGDVWVNIAFVRDDRLYRAERRLRVPATSQTLHLDVVTAQPVARPKDPGVFTIRVTDDTGAPVRAQLSIGVVDEALYGVKPDLTPDPVRFFHQRGYSQVGTQFSRDYGFVGYSGTEPLQLAQRRRPFTLADFKAERPERAAVRKDFPDAIFWTATLVTDREGLATVKVAYPDALTTWRLTARAVTPDTKAGTALARTTVTKDLILRLATPRFLTEGDLLQLPVTAHNYHDGERAVDVAVTATGLTPIESGPQVRRFTVSAQGEQTTGWSFQADRAGPVTIAGTAATSDDEDRLSLTFPVAPYGLERTVGVAGSTRNESPVRVSLEVPASSNPAGRRVDISLSPTLAGTMLAALDFLTTYPYGCTEQVLSSFLPNLLVLRSLNELHLAPTERLGTLDRMSAQGLRRLLEYQHDDGGWGWWAADRNHPFMTAYALYGLLEASRVGIPVDREALVRASGAAARLYGEYPRAVPELKAYITWVLSLAVMRDVFPATGADGWTLREATDDLWAARDRMSAYGQALFLLILDAQKDQRAGELAASLLTAAVTKGDLAWWPSDRDPLLGDQVDTTVEATALALQALSPRYATDATLDRAVRWLVANRSNGAYWGSTKQTAMALYGLMAVMAARGERPSTFDVDVLVNNKAVATHRFTPESWAAAEPLRVTTSAQSGANTVALVPHGAGALYWTASVRYFENQEPIERAGSRALAITREYFALAPVTVRGRIVYGAQPLPDEIRPGDLVLVRLTTAGAKDWRYLVVDDPIPAGMEAVTEPELLEFERPVSWWTGSRREYRDDRVVQFQESFEEGRYEHHYVLKAVTPGRYRAMPAQVQPMYVPGVGASTTTQAVTITSTTPTTVAR